VVDLIDQECAVAPGATVSGVSHGLEIEQSPGRIGRGSDQQSPWSCRTMISLPGLPWVGSWWSHPTGAKPAGLRAADEMPVAGIARVGQQPFVAGIDQYAQCQQQRAGCAGRDDDALR
jgi:hypothetical protein